MKNLLIQKLETAEKFKELVAEIERKETPISVSGLSFVGKSHVIASLEDTIKNPICLVTYNELQARQLVKDLSYFTNQVD